MRYVLIVVVFFSFPVFLYLLKKGPKERNLLFLALGLLPILAAPLHLEVSLLNWASWPGYAKGIIVSFADTLSLAICIYYRGKNRKPSLRSIWIIYFACNILGVFVGAQITPATFYLFSILRATLYFRACYLVACNKGMIPLINGLAIAVIANAFVAMSNSFGGKLQAGGLLGHQNISGLVTNLAVPALLTVGLQGRTRPLMLFAVACAAGSAIVGGSRGVIIFYGVSVILTMLFNIRIQPSPRKTTIFFACACAMVVAIPIAQYKLDARFENSGSQLTFEKDDERVRFEKVARAMIADHPLGVGLNQYTVTAMGDGYSDRAGISWTAGSRLAAVHNAYLLAWAEGGFLAFAGLCVLLWAPIIVSFREILRRQNPYRILAVPCLVSLTVLSFHARVEWVIVLMESLYGVALNYALVAASVNLRKRKVDANITNNTDPTDTVLSTT